MKAYREIPSAQTTEKANRYFKLIKSGKAPGKYLSGELERKNLDELADKNFLNCWLIPRNPASSQRLLFQATAQTRTLKNFPFWAIWMVFGVSLGIIAVTTFLALQGLYFFRYVYVSMWY